MHTEVSTTTSNYVASGGGAFFVDTGLFSANSRVRFRDITDGTSNTIAIGERAWTLWNTGKGAVNCNAGTVFGISVEVTTSLVTARHSLGHGLHGINQTGDDTLFPIIRDRCTRSFSSRHTGGAQFLLADGSVRFVSENVERDQSGGNGDFVYQNLLNKADGFVIGEF